MGASSCPPLTTPSSFPCRSGKPSFLSSQRARTTLAPPAGALLSAPLDYVTPAATSPCRKSALRLCEDVAWVLSVMTQTTLHSTRLGIIMILLGMLLISINDLTIKSLSDRYPLHQLVFARSAIGIFLSFIILQFEGGIAVLRTDRVSLHALRCLLIVIANMTFFTAIAVLPLATVTAMFFVAPLMITLLAVPVLGETVGPHRLGAIALGFVGVLIMVRPGMDVFDVPGWVLTLPILAAAGYAGMQVLTRKLGVDTPASAMAIYIQLTFILVSSLFWLVAGDGRYAEMVENESLIFLLRAWVWPAPEDWPALLMLGALSAGVGYALSQAYRLGDAATIAPFEYTALPLAIFWGWWFFDELPDAMVMLGIFLIGVSGVYVFVRERRLSRQVAGGRPVRRT